METENPNSSKQINENLTKVTVKKPKIPDTFQLCFAVKEQVGKSNIKVGKPLTVGMMIKPLLCKFVKIRILGATVAPKFYVNDPLKFNNLTEQLECLNIYGPREKYEYPITENQR